MADNEIKARFSLEDQVSNVIDGIKEKIDGFSLGALAAYAVVAEAVMKVAESVSKFTEKASEAQNIQNETIRITEQFGTVSGISAQKIGEMSEAISKKIALEADDVQAGINTLAQNPQIKASYDSIAIAAANISAAQNNGKLTAEGYQGTLGSLSTLLSGDLSIALKKLHKQHIDLTDAQKAEVQAAIDSGNSMKAQQTIIDAIGQNYKGAADNVNSYEYQQRRAKVANSEMGEAIGRLLLPAVTAIQKVIADVVMGFLDWTENSKSAHIAMVVFTEYCSTLWHEIQLIWVVLKDVVLTLYDFGKVMTNVMTGNFKAVSESATAIKAHLVEMGQGFATFGSQVVQSGKAIMASFDDQVKSHAEAKGKLLKQEKDGAAAIMQISKAAAAAQKTMDAAAIKAHKDLESQKQKIDKASGEQLKEIQAAIAEDERAIADAHRVDEMASKAKDCKSQQDLDKLNGEIIEAQQKNALDSQLKAHVESERQKTAATKLEHEQRKAMETALSDFMDAMEKLGADKNRGWFEFKKRASEANVLVKAAQAIMNIWATATELGPILGPILAGVETVAVGVIAGEQIAQIESQSFPQAAGGAYAPGDGATARFGEAGNPEWIMNQGNIKALAKEAAAAPQVSAYFLPTKQHVSAFSVANQQSQYRLKKEGRIS